MLKLVPRCKTRSHLSAGLKFEFSSSILLNSKRASEPISVYRRRRYPWSNFAYIVVLNVRDTLGSFGSIRKTATNRAEVLPWKIEEVSLVVYRCTVLFTLKKASFLVRFERSAIDKTIICGNDVCRLKCPEIPGFDETTVSFHTSQTLTLNPKPLPKPE